MDISTHLRPINEFSAFNAEKKKHTNEIQRWSEWTVTREIWLKWVRERKRMLVNLGKRLRKKKTVMCKTKNMQLHVIELVNLWWIFSLILNFLNHNQQLRIQLLPSEIGIVWRISWFCTSNELFHFHSFEYITHTDDTQVSHLNIANRVNWNSQRDLCVFASDSFKIYEFLWDIFRCI